jgi:hypothetical protein
MASTLLNKSSLKGLTRIGDILIPGNDEFPSFSAYMCMDHIDDLLRYAPKDDIKDLGMVLGILSIMPTSILKWLVKKMANAHRNEGSSGTLLRQLNLGIRGIVFSLYYSEKPGLNYKAKNPTEMIGFKLNKVQS